MKTGMIGVGTLPPAIADQALKAGPWHPPTAACRIADLSGSHRLREDGRAPCAHTIASL
jgi:hypothetical protein